MAALFWFLAVLFQVGAAARCRDGWTYYGVTNRCYAYFNTITYYYSASLFCIEQGMGGFLAMPQTIEQLQFVHSLRDVSSTYPMWLGLDDTASEGTFLWRDGRSLQYDVWQSGRPINSMYYNCVTMGSTPVFYDNNCFNKAAFVCQVFTTPDPCDGYTCENGGVCNSASGVAVCDCPPIFTGEKCEDIKMAIYRVTVNTPDVDNAGTDARVAVVIRGDFGAASIYIDGSQVDVLERGKTDSVTQDNLDVGKVTNITVQHDNSGANPGWFLGKVTVRKYGASSSVYVDYTFNCDCWLAVDMGDGSLSRTLGNPTVSSSA